MKKYFIQTNEKVNKALSQMSKVGEKCLIVVDNKKKLIGTLSDGDCRNIILKKKSLSFNLTIKNIYNSKPIFISQETNDKEKIKKIFLRNKINVIPVVDDNRIVKKILFFNDIFSNKNSLGKLPRNTKVIIMAGGLGSRLKPFTKVLPKALIPLNNKPFIEHIIERFKKNSARNFFISVNFKASILKAYFKSEINKEKITFVNEKSYTGTIGSLGLIKNKLKSSFFVTNCDVLINEDYSNIYNHHINKNYDLTIVAIKRNYNLPYGNCIINSSGSLVRIEEKPQYNFLVNSGFYIMKPTLLKFIKKNHYLDFDEFVKILQKFNYNIGIYSVGRNKWYDVGQWDEYFKTVNSIHELQNI